MAAPLEWKNPFDQEVAACRCEWGVPGLDALAPANVVIIIDVLSFGTCVDIAPGRGACILPYPIRNAAATARAAGQLGSTFNVCPAGERWTDGQLRPCLEDWLAAGAILRLLPGTKSPEALAAMAAFEAGRANLKEMVLASGSGRELVARGFSPDVDLAVELDVSRHASRLEGDAFRAFLPS
jgi:2-phosphosulfolactate phosphatase